MFTKIDAMFRHTCCNGQSVPHFPGDAKSNYTVEGRSEYLEQWQVAMEISNFLQAVILDLLINNTLYNRYQTCRHHAEETLFDLGQ